MKKTILLLSLAVFTVFSANANPVDVNVARNAGAKFLSANNKVQLRGNDLQLAKTYTINRGDTAFYVFNSPNGFVIVAGDDCAYPILGYSDNGRQFDINNIPIQLQDVLQDYQDQIQYGIEHNLVADEKTAEQWQLVKATGKLNNNRDNTQVGPLLTTTWDQGQYYNAMCPEDENGPDGHCVTGCVATAMAQIINYWEYPTHGRGSHSFNVSNLDPGSMCPGTNLTGYGTLYVDYENASYDYDNMPDALTSGSTQDEINAVAQLMYHCGVAVNMFYDTIASGAYIEDVRSALISYFGYAHTLGFAERQLYTDVEWEDSLRANIDRGEPVCYTGANALNSHAFVLDGYKQDNYFHFNFGWSGDCDGWFLTKAINVGWGFNDWQSAIMGIRPENDDHTVICHRKMYVQNNDSFTVTEPINLYPMRGGSKYQAVNEQTGVRINLNLLPEDAEGQLVLDVLDFDKEQSVVIYDGVNKDFLVRVIETRGYDDWNHVTNRNWVYDALPSDSVFVNMAGMDFSPIVSTRHGFTVVVYSNGGIPENFCLQVRNSTDTNPNTPTINNNIYWTDIVTSKPEGYLLDDDTIRITTAEGLAWVSYCLDSLWLNGLNYYQYYNKVISIEDNLDLGGYYWKPIREWVGNVEGNGHIITNMKVSTYSLGGLFGAVINSSVSDIGMIESVVNSVDNAGTIAGRFLNSTLNNSYSIKHLVNTGNSAGGGLVGDARNSQILNCYAYGDICAQFGYGGLVGYFSNTEMINCVSRVGESYDWAYLLNPTEWRGLLTEEVHGGSFYNCFADNVKMVQYSWPNFNNMAKRAYFLGNVYNVDAIENLAVFNSSIDPTGTLIADTAVNYTLGENMDVITALNNKVAEYNLPDLRTWVRDEVTHMPVFSDFYEVTCPNVSDITAENIVYNDGFAVALSWQENGDAEEWQVKYNILNAPEENAIVITTNTTQNTLQGLQLGNEYVFYVRPICGDVTIGWGQPFTFFVDKTLWIDMVTSCPDGYYEDSNGDVTISSPEGLAWLAKTGFDYRQNTISIVSDLDMGAYKWIPIGRYSFEGTVEGYNHIISNIYCSENMTNSNSNGTGLFGHANNASFKNIVIQNSSFSAYRHVGSLVGYSNNSVIENCHAVNIVAKGKGSVGGLGGAIYSDDTYNCSSSGHIYSDLDEGGLFGVHSGAIMNCYSSCTIHPLGYDTRMYYGGLIGTAVGIVNNCYSFGNIEMDANDPFYSWGFYYGGTSIGHLSNVNITNTYASHSGSMPFAAIFEEGVSLSDTASLVNNTLQTPVTISGTTYTDLLDALNAWVDANNTSGEYLRWVADTENQNGGFPMLEQQPSVTYQVQPLVQGWNWYSTYIEQDGTEGMFQLKSTLGGNGVQIKSQTMATQYLPNGSWLGTLTTLENEKSYRVNVSAPTTAVLQGTPVNPEEHPITLQPNWTWIGYPVSTTQSIAAATTGFTPRSGDMIKSQGSSSIYTGTMWFPSLNLEPGQGYLYKSTAAENRTLTFVQSREEEPQEETYQKYWTNDIHAFADNMTVVAIVTENGEEQYSSNYELGAFVNGENRGSARLEYYEPFDKYVAVLTISGEDGDRVTFGLVNRATENENFSCSKTIMFSTNAVLGTLRNLETIEFSSDNKTVVLTLFPNPVDKDTEFTIDIPTNEKIIEVIITNSVGSIIRDERALKGNTIKGLPQSGVYNIQIITEQGNNYHGRVIVK